MSTTAAENMVAVDPIDAIVDGVRSPKVSGELYGIARRQVDIEIARFARTEQKAAGLLAAAGLSLTVAFTFGAQLLSATKLHDNLGRAWIALLACYGLAACSGLIAAICAVRALRVSGKLVNVNEETIFDPAILAQADAIEDDDGALAHYQQFLTGHFWSIAKAYLAEQQRKTTLVLRGQGFFTGFVVLLAPIIVLVTVASGK